MAAKLLIIDVWVIESFSDVVTGTVVALERVVVDATLAICSGVRVLAGVNANFSTVVINALEFRM